MQRTDSGGGSSGSGANAVSGGSSETGGSGSIGGGVALAEGAGWQVVVLSGLLGALAGVALAIVGDALSRSDIRGETWSLRGNGAILIPFGGGPAVLAGGWAALARWRLLDRRWARAGIVTGLATLAIAVLLTSGPLFAVAMLGDDVLAGNGQPSTALSSIFLVTLGLAAAAGLGLAVSFARRSKAAVAVLVTASAAGVAVVAGLPVALFLVGPLLLPLITGLPLVVASRRVDSRTRALFGREWLAGACVALVVGMVGGLLVAQAILSR